MSDRKYLSILFLASILAGCSTRLVESEEVLVETRGIPIVRVVIEGPGGDLVPVTYEKTEERIFVFEEKSMYQYIAITLSSFLLSFCLGYWYFKVKAGKDC